MTRVPWVVAAAGTLAVLSVAPLAAQGPVLRVDTAYGCVKCHVANRRAFVTGVHSERGIRCHDCHGGNPAAVELPGAHQPGFLGSPSKLRTATLCATCHSDPVRMRQYGLPEDQLAGLRTSRHGQLLDRGDDAAPTCTDCHDAHTIRRATDVRSKSHPLNIPATCGVCHEDAELMRPYGIPVDQLIEFHESAHGVALFEHENFAAPTCIGCHGSHSALPPGVSETADVCGQCHQLVRQAYFSGPHGNAAAEGLAPGCLACHANHATERIGDDAFAETCLVCHAADSPQALRGEEVEEQLVAAGERMGDAEHALGELVRAGHDVSDLRTRYRAAITQYRQLAQVQHSLDLDRLEDLTLRVRSITADIDEAAEVAAEHGWEHKLLLIPVWFLALAVVVLAAFRLHELRGTSPGGSS